MRNEPTDLSITSGATRNRSGRRHDRVAPVTGLTTCSTAADALDAAFEDYTRVDTGSHTAEAAGGARTMTKELIADISAQLDILNRQREQLAALLREVTL